MFLRRQLVAAAVAAFAVGISAGSSPGEFDSARIGSGRIVPARKPEITAHSTGLAETDSERVEWEIQWHLEGVSAEVVAEPVAAEIEESAVALE
jgi:hypothetical protein